MTRGFISQLLRNPIYAQADLDMYEFFKSQGTVVVNEATDLPGQTAAISIRAGTYRKEKTST